MRNVLGLPALVLALAVFTPGCEEDAAPPPQPVIGAAALDCLSKGTASSFPESGGPPVGASAQVLYWPDAKTEAESLGYLLDKIGEGATVYIRAGTYSVPIPKKWNPDAKEFVVDKKAYRGVHLRGAGHG